MVEGNNDGGGNKGIINPNASLSSPTNKHTSNLPFTKGTNSFDIKIDWGINERNHLSGRYSWQKVNTFQAPAFGSFYGGPSGGGFQVNGVDTAVLTVVIYSTGFFPALFPE